MLPFHFYLSILNNNNITKANRTVPTLDDVACAFNKHKISLCDLEEFINWVDTPDFALGNHVKPLDDEESQRHANGLGASMFRRSKKRSYKMSRDTLGYCDDRANQELLDRDSEEEFEHVYDYFPLMTRIAVEAPAVVETQDSAETQVNEAEKVLIDSNDTEHNLAEASKQPEVLPEVVKHGIT